MQGFSVLLCAIRALFQKELVQLKRDKTTLRMIVGIPIIQLLIFGFAINSDPRFLPTALVVSDRSPLSIAVLEGLKNTEYYQFTHVVNSIEQAQYMLQSGVVNFVVHIPADFTQNLMTFKKTQILVQADASDPVAISGAYGSLERCITSILKSRFPQFFSQQGSLSHLEIFMHKLYNPEGLNRYNIVPGLIGTVLTMTGVMMTAISLTRERERGTLETLLSMPLSPLSVMIGKMSPYIVLSYIQAMIILILAYLVFSVPITGSCSALFFAILLFIFCNLSLGFLISTLAQNQMQAMQMSMFIILPSLLLSGFMFPFRGMPLWAQKLGLIFPNTYFISLVRAVMLKGAGWQANSANLFSLIVFCLLMTLFTLMKYQRTLE